MRVHVSTYKQNEPLPTGTYSEISLERFFEGVNLSQIFRLRGSERITDIYITSFGVKARIGYDNAANI